MSNSLNSNKGNIIESTSKFYLSNDFKYSIIFSIAFILFVYKMVEMRRRKSVASSKNSTKLNSSILQIQKLRKKRNKKKKNKNFKYKNNMQNLQNRISSEKNKNKEVGDIKELINGSIEKKSYLTCWTFLKNLICYYFKNKGINNKINNRALFNIEKNIKEIDIEERKEKEKINISLQAGQSLEEKGQAYHFHHKNENFQECPKNKEIKNLKNENKSEKEIYSKFGYTKFNLNYIKEDNSPSLEYGPAENEKKEKEIQEINLVDEKVMVDNLKEKNDLLEEMRIYLLDLMIFIMTLETEIDKKISNENHDYLKSQIKSNIIKMLNIFRFFNNIRLILFYRKSVNKIIQNEIKNNSKIHISKTVFLNDFTGFNYKNDEQKLKLFVSQFIVQIGDGKLPQNIYNLVLDFLFYLKNYLKDSFHLLNPSKEITKSKQSYSMLYSKNEREKNEIKNFNINLKSKKNKYRNENLKNINEISIMINSKKFIYDINNINNDISNKKIIKIEEITLALNNVINLKNDIKNLIKYISDNKLESHLTKEYENNDFEEESIFNFNFSYSNTLHDLENDSINNLKKIFVNFFSQDENGNNFNNLSSNILEKEKEKIRNEYLKIIKKIISTENIINNIYESYKITDYKYKKLIEKLKRNKEHIKYNINYIRKWLYSINNKLFKFYDLLLLSISFKIKVKAFEKKFLKDENFLSFEKIFKEWKKNFNEKYIREIKFKYCNDENFNYIEVPEYFRFNNKKIAYLKSSKLYRAFIDEKELSNMNSKKMMSLIDEIIKGENINIQDTGEEINYYDLKKLNEEEFLK